METEQEPLMALRPTSSSSSCHLHCNITDRWRIHQYLLDSCISLPSHNAVLLVKVCHWASFRPFRPCLWAPFVLKHLRKFYSTNVLYIINDHNHAVMLAIGSTTLNSTLDYKSPDTHYMIIRKSQNWIKIDVCMSVLFVL